MENKHLVFVFGTLRKNERNHYLLKASNCLAEQAWTTGSLYGTNYGYPVLQENKRSRVYGEIYEVNSSQLARLDELEGYRGEGESNYYDRITKRVHTDEGVHEAYVYVMNNANSDMELLKN
ncbi:gamma-glutamylcyclotransferase family protein [Bacillus sp. DJP31]|uniref:gamma-glutamylcyclotransferase family protein n=1 Tax=Bacillus sp. DJP31 TaxID=3409789 RepID=UPI003BB66A13